MLVYVTLGSNDVARAQRFYDPVLATLGCDRREASAVSLAYSNAGDEPIRLYVGIPFDQQPAGTGNGAMTCFLAQSRAAVDAFHAAALVHGGTDEGAPGLRQWHANFYACYVRDPDGNKLSALCEKPV